MANVLVNVYHGSVRWEVLNALCSGEILSAKEISEAIDRRAVNVHRELVKLEQSRLVRHAEYVYPKLWQITPEGVGVLESVRRDREEFLRANPAPEPPSPLEAEMQRYSDPLYDEAVRLANKYRKLSVSFLQRRVRIGYTRAQKLMDDIVGSGDLDPDVSVKR